MVGAKPHIYKSLHHWPVWLCHVGPWYASGHTPRQAYEQWMFLYDGDV